MKLNKKSREEIGSLSRLVFGSSSKWQKLLTDPNFQVLDETIEPTEEESKYVGVVNKNGSKTIVSRDKAKTLGLIEEDASNTYKKYAYRQMNEDELRKYLSDCLDSMILACVPPDELPTVYAQRLVEKRLKYSYALKAIDEDKEKINKLMESEDFPAFLKDSVLDALSVDEQTAKQIGELDGVSMVEALIVANKEGGKEVYNEVMLKAEGLFNEIHYKRFG